MDQTELERAVLGAMMLDGRCAARGARVLNENDFTTTAHQYIFIDIRIRALFGKPDAKTASIPADPVSVASSLANWGQLGAVGGAEYLHDLIAAAVPAISFKKHLKALARAGLARRLREG